MSIKKVFLVGDYSAFQLNLRDGLRELGVEATLASGGDFARNHERDIDLAFTHSGNKVKDYLQLLKMYSKASKHFKSDVVQFVTPRLFYGRYADRILFEMLKLFNRKIFYAACCADVAYFKAYREGATEKYGYSIQENMIKDYYVHEENKNKPFHWEEEEFVKKENSFLKYFDGIIPVGYDYYMPYQFLGNKKCRSIIPLSINFHKLDYKDNAVKGKIKFFHGISTGREFFKGSELIVSVLETLKEKYPNDVELIFVKEVSNTEYVKKLSEANILVDQINSYDIGMAALQGMAMCKAVLTGAEQDALTAKGFSEVPYFNITPKSDDLKNKLEYLIANRNQLSEIGFKGRSFVEQNHGHIQTAQKYLSAWEE